MKDVVPNREVLEEGGDLEGTDQTLPSQLMGLETGHVLTLVRDRTLGRFEEPGYEVQGGGLPRSVRPDEAHDVTLLHAEVQAVDRREAAEELGQPLGLEQRHR